MIVRAEKNKNYTTIANFALEDPGLSLKAKGLWAFIMSKPNDWKINSRGLTNQLKEGRDSVMAALRELKEAGYLVEGLVREKDGKFSQGDSTIYETPQTENPWPENPTTENPTTKVNTNKVNTETLSKDKVVSKKEIDPQAYSLSHLLLSFIRNRNPRSRSDERAANKWAADIEKINRLDKYTWPEIEKVIRWAQADTFWQDNILSGSKLREKFERLFNQSTKETEENEDVVIRTMKKQGLM